MKSNIIKKIVLLAVVLASLAGGVYYCWTIRELPQDRRNACKKANADFKNCKDEEVLPFLRKLADERFFTARFNGKFPWMHLSYETRVPVDFIGQIAEDAFYRFAGRGTAETADAPRLKELLAFSQMLYPRCTEEERITLRERQVDACFFLNDFDGAIALIEKGLPGHSEIWTRGTVAKLRAHKAMLACDSSKDAAKVAESAKEVVKQLLVFDEYLRSEEMGEHDDEYDQTTGALYSKDWIMARNFMRCSIYSRKAGDAAEADRYLALAKEHYAKAVKKAKDDKVTSEELKRDMKSYGL